MEEDDVDTFEEMKEQSDLSTQIDTITSTATSTTQAYNMLSTDKQKHQFIDTQLKSLPVYASLKKTKKGQVSWIKKDRDTNKTRLTSALPLANEA